MAGVRCAPRGSMVRSAPGPSRRPLRGWLSGYLAARAVVGLSGALALAGSWGGWRQSPCADECSRPSTLVQAIFGDEKQIADVVREQLRRVWVPTRTRCVEPMKSSRLARRQANDPNQTAGQHGSAVRLVRQTAVHREGRTAECW